jgi:hypothetical protein
LWTTLETVSDFRLLIDREELSTMCLSYDTTFEMGDFYVSVLTYWHNEFEETPVIPLMFMIHMERIEYVHSFFFSRVERRNSSLKLQNPSESLFSQTMRKPSRTQDMA